MTAVLLGLAIAGMPQRDAKSLFATFGPAVLQVNTPNGNGTAFVVSGGKYAVTCRHVVDHFVASPKSIRVGGVAGAEVVVLDETLDLALLRLAKPQSHGLQLAKKKPLKGEKLHLIGYPRTAKGRTISTGDVAESASDGFILNAPSAPGGSGSPVLNSKGEVVGVVFGVLPKGLSMVTSVSSLPQLLDYARQQEKLGKPVSSLYFAGAVTRATGPIKVRLMPNEKSPILENAKKDSFHFAVSSHGAYYRVAPFTKTLGYVLKKDVQRFDQLASVPLAVRTPSAAKVKPHPQALKLVTIAKKAAASSTKTGATEQRLWANGAWVKGFYTVLKSDLPGTSFGQVFVGERVSWNALIPGDRLYFFGSIPTTPEVGVYAGEDSYVMYNEKTRLFALETLVPTKRENLFLARRDTWLHE